MRMRRIAAAASMLLLIAPQNNMLHAGEAVKRLTNQQIIDKLPEGIQKQSAVPVRYVGNKSLLYSKGGRSYLYDLKTGEVSDYTGTGKIAGGKMKELVPGWVNPTWSPDSTRIAYTLDNDLYSMEVLTGKTVRHTFDGSDVILNGYASWVYYEEIFGRPSQYRAFWWSPDSKIIAYYRFDNSKVPVFPIYNPDGQHGSLNMTRYPEAGDSNPEVKIGFVSVNGGETVWADFDSSGDQYFGIPFWSADGRNFMVAWMDRAQDNMELFCVNPDFGDVESVYKEHQNCWIDWMEQMEFSDKGIYIVRDFSGWQQIYFLSYDGKEFNQLTDGRNWSVNFLKLDGKYLYFTAKRENLTRTDIYRLNVNSKKLERISFGDYSFSNVVISDDGRNVAAVASNAVTPSKLVNISLAFADNIKWLENFSLGGKKPYNRTPVTVIEDMKGDRFDDYAIALPQIINIRLRDGREVPAKVIWPVDMDKSRKYPVKVNIYGGPDHPQVYDRWTPLSFANQWWANHGVIQVVLDNRAGGYFGKKGIEEVYRKLAVLEIEDFVDGIRHFLNFPYVDSDKIGIEGFSFGGTMTALCVTEANEYFKYGIAGGGVYDWALYDSHYTERYMDRPQDNPDGYRAGCVLERVGNYRGDDSNMLRLTHGTGDDNVHFQNTLQLVDRLQKDHKDFELMIYPNGMHGYRGDQRRQSDLQDYIFWYRYLLNEDVPQILRDHFQKD